MSSLREGNSEAAGFKTRIPRPAPRTPTTQAPSLSAATENNDNVVPPEPASVSSKAQPRATAAGVKSALAAATSRGGRSTNKDKENAPSSAANDAAGATTTATGTKRKPASAPHASPGAKKRGARAAAAAAPAAPLAAEFDAEYDALLALKLATKDTKFDFKAQLVVAKDFTARAKALMKSMRDAVAASENAVADARDELLADVDDAEAAAKEAKREAASIAAALDAARAEAQTSAASLAAATKREAALAKRGEETAKALATSRANEASLTEKTNALAAELAPLRENLAREQTAHALLQKQASDSIAAAAEAGEKISSLLTQQAASREELGTLKGANAALEAQLDAANEKAAAREREAAREAEETNRLHACVAKTKAERDAAEHSLAESREEAASARASAADASVAVAEAKTRCARLEDAAEHAAGDLARAIADAETASAKHVEASSEVARLKPALQAAEEARAKTERDAAITAANAEKERLRLENELNAATTLRRALEPRVESLGAELAESRADAKIARSEIDRLRKGFDESKDRVVATDAERQAAVAEATTLKQLVSDLEREREVVASKLSAAEAALEASRAECVGHGARADAAAREASEARAAAADAAALSSRLDALRRAHDEQSEALAAARRQVADASANSSTAQQRLREREAVAESVEGRVSLLEALLSQREAELRQAAVVRRALHNQVQELKGNIRVFCRVRPPSKDGREERVDGGGGRDGDKPLLSLATRGEMAGRRVCVAPPGGTKAFEFDFDRVFGADASQRDVFEEISHLVQSALDGYKVCVFTYGQTGSGKTYTMLGDGEDDERERDDHSRLDGEPLDGEEGETNPSRGLIPRSIEQIFAARDAAAAAAAEDRGATPPSLEVTASMIEIYNEDIIDLLGPKSSSSSGSTTKHDVKHDASGKTTVTGLRTVAVSSPAEVAKVMKRAQAARRTAKTAMNDHSSRSHMVFTLALDGVDATGRVVHGALNLVDLAGSERLSRSGAVGQQLKEAQAINKSLSALGDVITSLANKDAHVPFRNSKLTYLLQNALGGDGKTLMLVNVAPGVDSSQETLCSLRFASKVNDCAMGRGK